MKKTCGLALLILAGLLCPGTLFSHGVEVYDISGSAALPAAAVHFKYSTGEAMAFAKIRLFAPSRPDVEALSSLADRNGRFSFIPDEEGPWTVEAADGMGHQGSITLNRAAVELTGAAPAGPEKQASLLTRMILGLSLILNIFAVYSLVIRGIIKKRGGHAHQ